jgi:hypothetical protein
MGGEFGYDDTEWRRERAERYLGGDGYWTLTIG